MNHPRINQNNGNRDKLSLLDKLKRKVNKDYSATYGSGRPPPPTRLNTGGQVIRLPPAEMYQPPVHDPRQPTHAGIYLPTPSASTEPTEEQKEKAKRYTYWQARMERMKDVLAEFNLQQFAENFKKADVSVENVEYLSDGDFYNLGFTCIGDKCRLKSRCQKLTKGMSDKFMFDGENDYKELVEEREIEEVNRHPTATEPPSPRASTSEVNRPPTATEPPSPLASTSAVASDMTVEMGAEARFDMGDKDNVIKTEQNITAEYIETVGPVSDTAHNIDTAVKVKTENKLTVKMEERATFEAGNRNNVIEKQVNVEANKINNVTGNPGSDGASLPGVGNYINIALGENAACNLNSLANIDIKEKEEPAYFVVNFVEYSNRKPGHFKKKRERESFENEFGIFIFRRLLQIYGQPTATKNRPVRIKQNLPREKMLVQEEWSVLIYDQMMHYTLETLNDCVKELSQQLRDEENKEIVEIVSARKESNSPIEELPKEVKPKENLQGTPRISSKAKNRTDHQVEYQPKFKGTERKKPLMTSFGIWR